MVDAFFQPECNEAVSDLLVSTESMPAALKAWPWKNSQGILVSPLDKRQYRWLRLENGLQVKPSAGVYGHVACNARVG